VFNAFRWIIAAAPEVNELLERDSVWNALRGELDETDCYRPKNRTIPKGERVDDENVANAIASDDLAIVGDERGAFRQSRSR
jgi:hypothetical protein